jgi:hypothetical protein
MAELQWIIEVRCINALLAEIKVGERGEYFIVNIPDRDFLPSELDKLIRAFEIASRINEENRVSYEPQGAGETVSELGGYVEIIDERDFARVSVLSTGEIVNVDVPERLLAPSEARGFLDDLRAVRYKMTELRGDLER